VSAVSEGGQVTLLLLALPAVAVIGCYVGWIVGFDRGRRAGRLEARRQMLRDIAALSGERRDAA
jgi:hypothetical protein